MTFSYLVLSMNENVLAVLVCFLSLEIIHCIVKEKCGENYNNNDWRYQILLILSNVTSSNFRFIHCCAVLIFYTSWKHQKTQTFYDVFRGYRKASPDCNGLNFFMDGWQILRFYMYRCFDVSIYVQPRLQRRLYLRLL